MNKAFIISYYNSDNPIKRTGTPSAVTVVDYLSEILNDIGYNVEILSPSWYLHGKSRKLVIKGKENIKSNISLSQPPSLARHGKLFNMINKGISRFWVILQLCFHVKYCHPIFVYHHPTLIFPVKIACFLKRAKIIMVTEELYSDIMTRYKNKNKMEVDYLVKMPVAYVFPTALLDTKTNFNNRPSMIIHGTYHIEESIGKKREDNKIHVVYAGTFNPTKGGALAAAAAAYLPSNYHVHIIGFGTEDDRKLLVERIDEIKEKALCDISFDGLKTGREYIQYIQNCDIGLSVQNPDAAYNETSFPSKVLSYLSNGLRVVSIRIKALETSAVSDLLYYYDEQKPEAIAKAIMEVDITKPYDSRKHIQELNEKAHQDMKEVLSELGYD